MINGTEARVREILATVKPLAAEFYRLTGKPLGVTGEVAEYEAAEILGLTLVPARTVGYDALRGHAARAILTARGVPVIGPKPAQPTYRNEFL
jgi:hypothetical protein